METRTCIEAEPYALQVTDDSMAPEFPRGCVIVIDPTGRATDGAFVLAAHEGGYLLRRLRLEGEAVWLEALSPEIPSIRADGLSAIRGVVTQRAGSRRKDHKRYG